MQTLLGSTDQHAEASEAEVQDTCPAPASSSQLASEWWKHSEEFKSVQQDFY